MDVQAKLAIRSLCDLIEELDRTTTGIPREGSLRDRWRETVGRFRRYFPCPIEDPLPLPAWADDERRTDSNDMRIVLDGSTYVASLGNGRPWTTSSGVDVGIIETATGEQFYVFASQEDAGKAARDYWKDMAQDDPSEFAIMVGEKTLVAWALSQPAGPGSRLVTSLDEWLDLWLDTPEEQWASYDGEELEVNRVGRLAEELGFIPRVAYRWN